MLIFLTAHLLGLLTSHFTVFACSNRKSDTRSTVYVSTSRVLTAPCQPPTIATESQDIMRIAEHLVYETFRSMLIGEIPRTRHLIADLGKSSWRTVLHDVDVEGREFIISVVGERLSFDLIQSAEMCRSILFRGAYNIEAFLFVGLFEVDKSLGEVTVLEATNYQVLDSVEDKSLTTLKESIRRNVVLTFNFSISNASCRLV